MEKGKAERRGVLLSSLFQFPAVLALNAISCHLATGKGARARIANLEREKSFEITSNARKKKAGKRASARHKENSSEMARSLRLGKPLLCF